MPRSSLIVLCRDDAAAAIATIEACLVQPTDDLEVLAIDENSTRTVMPALETHAIARDGRVRLLRSIGETVGANRMAALEITAGAYTAFLEAGVWIDPKTLARQANVLDENPDIDLVFCGRTLAPLPGIPQSQSIEPRALDGHTSLLELAFRGHRPPLSMVLIRRTMLRPERLDRTAVTAGSADLDLWMHLGLAAARYHVLDTDLLCHRTVSLAPDICGGPGESTQIEAVFARIMTDYPEASARALLRTQRRLRDAECAAGQLRSLIGSLRTERDAAVGARDAAAAARAEADRAALADASSARLSAWMTTLGMLDSLRSAGRPLVIWGAGAAGRQLLGALRAVGCSADGFLDGDAAKEGTLVEGLPVASLRTLAADRRSRPYVLVASMHAVDITARLHAHGWRDAADFQVADLQVALRAAELLHQIA